MIGRVWFDQATLRGDPRDWSWVTGSDRPRTHLSAAVVWWGEASLTHGLQMLGECEGSKSQTI